MVKVFICYGGSNGRVIGLDFRTYLTVNCHDITPFLAGKGSPDITAGENFQQVIDEELRDTHVMVTICDLKLMFSRYARQEIITALDEGILIIPFLMNGKKLPDRLKDVWAPVRYNPENVTAGFPQLYVAIQESLLMRLKNYFVRDLGTNPDTGIPLTTVRHVGRVR